MVIRYLNVDALELRLQYAYYIVDDMGCVHSILPVRAATSNSN